MSKKIVLLGSAYPYKVGSSQFNERLAQEFGSNDFDITIFTFTLQYPSFLFPGKSQFSDKEKPEGLKIARKINTINPFNWIKVGRELKRLKPDIVLIRYMMPFMSPSMGTIARIAKKNKITKIIGLIDNAIPHEKRLGDNLLSNYFFKPIDKFLYMSDKVKNDLATFGVETNTAFCPHPLFDFYGEKIPKKYAAKNLNIALEPSYLLFFGIIRNYKGLDLLLNAFNHEYFKDNNIKLLVAGEFYSDYEKYETLIKELQLEKQVIVHNRFIPDAEVSSYFSLSDLLVLPYKSATQSGVTQVGFFYDIPMLVTNVGGLGELIDKSIGYIVEPNSKEIQTALIDFYQNKRQQVMSSSVSIKKEDFSWKRMVNTINKISDEN